MKYADLYFYKTLEEIQKTIVAHDLKVSNRFDKIDSQLKLILKDESKYVSKELEEVIREVAARAVVIDEKVSDVSE